MKEESKYKVETPMAPIETQMPQILNEPLMPQMSQMPQMYQMPMMQQMPMMSPTPMVCCPLLMNVQCPMMHGQGMPGNNFMQGYPYTSSPYMMNHSPCDPLMGDMMQY